MAYRKKQPMFQVPSLKVHTALLGFFFGLKLFFWDDIIYGTHPPCSTSEWSVKSADLFGLVRRQIKPPRETLTSVSTVIRRPQTVLTLVQCINNNRVYW